MLRSIHLKNFVKFKDHQFLQFDSDGPSIFIGENGSGKSSVFEGIRRCLKQELSTSVSTTPDSSQLSYFICNFENTESEAENILCGIVRIPEIWGQKYYDSKVDDKQESGQPDDQDVQRGSVTEFDADLGLNCLYEEKTFASNEALPSDSTASSERTGERTSREAPVPESTKPPSFDEYGSSGGQKIQRIDIVKSFKFALPFSKKVANSEETVYFVEVTQNKTDKRKGAFRGEEVREFINYICKGETTDQNIQSFLQNVFGKNTFSKKTESKEEENCDELLEALSSKIVFTFPLRSVGPLQWSESERIALKHRKENYVKAENRCEILKCFLLNKKQGTEKFDYAKEDSIFRTIIRRSNYEFRLDDGKIVLPEGKFALLKTPEGILEAKTLSILLSGKQYKTIILEEPDRGMHPQFTDRMLQVITQHRNEKQVILTTHNTALITPWSFPNCFVFRRKKEQTRIVTATKKDESMKMLRLLTSDHLSDVVFANKVLFYEGDSEMLFFTELKKQILQGDLREIDIFCTKKDEYRKLKNALSGLTLITMNSKDNAKHVHEQCKRLSLPHLIIIDNDEVRTDQSKPNSNGRNSGNVDDGTRNDIAKNSNNENDEQQQTDDTKNDFENITSGSSVLSNGNKIRNAVANSIDSKGARNPNVQTNEPGSKNSVVFLEGETTEEAVSLQTIIKTGNNAAGSSNSSNSVQHSEERKERNDAENLECEKKPPVGTTMLERRSAKIQNERTFFWIDGDIEDTIMKMAEHSQGLLDDLRRQNVLLNKNRYHKKKKRHQKLFLHDDVSLANIQESVKLILRSCKKSDDLYELLKLLMDEFHDPEIDT